jgi:hypothetical protein
VPATQLAEALHVSAPLQALPSPQLVPWATGAWSTPAAGLHESVVHGLPSSTTGGVPPKQTALALHASVPLHALLSEQLVPAATGRCATPVAGLQASAVHGLPSSTAGATPATQLAEALHVSAPLHALPSEQLVPGGSGVCTGIVPEKLSAVHGLPSSTLTGAQIELPPDCAWQLSPD